MRLAVATTFAALTLAATAGPAAAIETINCERDHNPAERTICSSQKLQVLDANVTEAYADIMLDGHVKGYVKQAVAESQLTFLKRRDTCGRNVECLAEVMSMRVTRISYYR